MWLDDVTDSVGQTFLAHAMQCAKCHDHKFDPVPTRDYYGMMAVFSTTQFAERKAPFPSFRVQTWIRRLSVADPVQDSRLAPKKGTGPKDRP